MAVLTKKIAGATLVEVIIALVILSIVLVLSLGTYLNIIRSNNLDRKTLAANRVNYLVEQTLKQGVYLDQEVEEETFTVAMDFEEYNGKHSGLLEMRTAAIAKNGSTIYERKDVVIKD